MTFLYILVGLGAMNSLKKREINKYALLIITQIFVTFGVYIFIEVQPRYLYHIQISVLIVAALGISALNDIFTKIFIKKKTN